MKIAKVRRNRTEGFTLIETLITLLIMSIIMAAVFQQINTATKRSAAEQTKLDMFQETREFVDQMTRDIKLAGYPNRRNFQNTSAATNASAEGIVLIGPGDIWFQGDVDGNGHVSMVKYHLDTTTDNNCPCLRRSRVDKISYDSIGNTSDDFSVEVQGVQNINTTNWVTANPVFSYFTMDGTQVDLSAKTNNRIDAADFPDTGDSAATDPEKQTLASITRVKVQLSVQAKYADLQTQLKPIITLNSTVMILNCNRLAQGQAYAMACL
jgi:prepilin-type N-terminal cleavage/methylation domain-containing protein